MSSRKELSTKEREILDRQRTLAAARRKQQQQQQRKITAAPPPPPPPPPPPTSKLQHVGSNFKPKKSISELLAPSSSSRSRGGSRSKSGNGSVSSYNANYSTSTTSAGATTNMKRKQEHLHSNGRGNFNRNGTGTSTDRVIDLTSSPELKPKAKLSTTKRPAPPPNPPKIAAGNKRPTKRSKVNFNSNDMLLASKKSLLRPSNSTVEKAIASSRSRVHSNLNSNSNTNTDANAYAQSSSLSTSTSTSTQGPGVGGAFSSLLSKTGITEQQLQKKIKVVSKENEFQKPKKSNLKRKNNGGSHSRSNSTNIDFRNSYSNSYDDDDDDTINMEMYFNAIREWDFLSALNEERMNNNSNNNQNKNKNKSKKNSSSAEGKENINNTKDGNGNGNGTSSSSNNNSDRESEPIPDTFTSRRQYQNLWTPLCLEEARAQILSDALSDVPRWSGNGNGNNNGNNNKQHNKNNNKWNNNNNNSAISLIPILATPHSKDVGSNNPNMTIIIQKQESSSSSSSSPDFYNYNRSTSFMSNDLVVLAKDKSIFMQASKGKLYDNHNSNTLSSSSATATTVKTRKIMGCVGVVEYGRKTIEGLPIKISREKWLKLCTGKKEEKMVLLKLGCNVTNMREFSALCRIGTLPLLPYLLCKKINKAKDSFDELSEMLTGSSGAYKKVKDGGRSISSSSTLIDNMGGKAELGQGFTKYAKEKFNPSQLGAISAAASEYGQGGFTLVKGPPGNHQYLLLLSLTISIVLNILLRISFWAHTFRNYFCFFLF